MYPTVSRILRAICFALVSTLFALGSTARAEPTDKAKKMLAEVSARLLAVCDKPSGYEWDKIDIGFMQESRGINAHSTFKVKDGKKYPIIRIGEKLMALVVLGEKPGDEANAEDRLAFVVGHELGHLVKDHFSKTIGDRGPVLELAFERDQEIEADLFAQKLLLKAGYDLNKALVGMVRMKEVQKQLGLDYSSFEGLGANHPSWDKRLEKADKDKAELWKSMAAFENGVAFLATEDYDTAIRCFDIVTRQFPGCYEGWANLGYARLMKYCDQWSQDDMKKQGIGQVVVGGFYTRAKSIKLRNKEKGLWFAAVGALRESNRLKPGQTVVLANLGLAYLLSPDGKDVESSTEFFAEAAKAAKNDKDLDPVANAALLINLGVNSLAGGNPEKALAQLDEGEKAVRSLAIASKRPIPKFDSALLYTRALLLAGKSDPSDKEQAHAMLEKYLRICSLRSLWWDQGYDKYKELCEAIGKQPKPRESFRKDRPEPTRLVTGIKVKGGTITLGDDVEDVEKLLGKGVESIAVQTTTLRRIRYEKEGIEVLASEEVLAIILSGPAAPAIPLRGKMTGPESVGVLKIGMTTDEVDALLGDLYDTCEIVQSGVVYHFYREQGVAVRKEKGKVIGLVVVTIPEK
jgi:tetratricopeptide (TPR) repeat protein